MFDMPVFSLLSLSSWVDIICMFEFALDFPWFDEALSLPAFFCDGSDPTVSILTCSN